MSKILRHCCVCDLVIAEDGKLTPKKDIDSKKYKFSSTFLSQKCYDDYVDVIIKSYHSLPKQCDVGENYKVLQEEVKKWN